MLNTTPENLHLEIDQAIAMRNRIVDCSEQRHRQYTGSTWMEGFQPDIEPHENLAFDTVINTQPFLVYSNPQVKVASRRPTVHRAIAGATTHAMNRWIRDVAFEETLAEGALDIQFDFTVWLVSMEPLPGYENKEAPPLRPSVTRISPRRYFQDPQANSKRSVRFQGHEWLRDLEDLKAAEEPDPSNPGKRRKVYNAEALAKLEGIDDTIGGSPQRIGEPPSGIQKVPRKQIRGYEVYVPETRMIYTLGTVQSRDGKSTSVYLRDPRPAKGHPGGPYVLGGIYAVPDYAYPVAPLAIADNLVEELNAQIDQVSEQADAARQFTIVNGDNKKAARAIKNARNLDVLAIPGFSPEQCQVITYGGPSREQLDYIERLRDRLDRKSGTAEFTRGNVTGAATARENSLAAAAIDVRRKFMQRQFRLCVREVLMKVLYILVSSKNVVFHVPVPKGYFDEDQGPMQAGNQTETEDGLFLGGQQEGEDFTFFDLELTIEPMSMELQDEALIREQIQQAFALIIQAAPLMLQFPFINWPAMMDDLFESLNQKDGRKYINFEMLQQMLQQQFAAGQVQQVPGLEGQKVPTPQQLAPGGRGQFGPWPGTSAGMERGQAQPDVSKLVALLQKRTAA